MSIKDSEVGRNRPREITPGRTTDLSATDYFEAGPNQQRTDGLLPYAAGLELLALSPTRPLASEETTESRVAQMEKGAVPAALAQLFRWLPPTGREDDPECRLGNRLKEYLNATSERSRQQALEQLKKEAPALGAKAVKLLQTTLAFDALMRLFDARSNMDRSPVGADSQNSRARDEERLALADLAALCRAPGTEAIKKLMLSYNTPAQIEQAHKDAFALSQLRSSEAIATLDALLPKQAAVGTDLFTQKPLVDKLNAIARDSLFSNQSELIHAAQLAELLQICGVLTAGDPYAAADALRTLAKLDKSNKDVRRLNAALNADPRLKPIMNALFSAELPATLAQPGAREAFGELLQPFAGELQKLVEQLKLETPPVPPEVSFLQRLRKASENPPSLVPADSRVPDPALVHDLFKRLTDDTRFLAPGMSPDFDAQPFAVAADQLFRPLPPLVSLERLREQVAAAFPLEPSQSGEPRAQEGYRRPGRVLEPMGPEKPSASDKKDVWKEYRLEYHGFMLSLPVAGDSMTIGRNPDQADICIANNKISREHCRIEMRSDGVYVSDLESTNGTTIIRAGKEIKVTQAIKLEPGDLVRLGKVGNPELTWLKPGAPKERYRPAGYKPEKIEDGAGQEARDRADPAASRPARDASNGFLVQHQYDGRLPDGFQSVGGFNTIDARGQHNDRDRFSVVVDTRPEKDPTLAKFIADCKRDLAHLKDRPEELAKELAKRAKAAMEPRGWSSQQVDEGYRRLRDENAGGRLLLGDLMSIARRGQGAGACMQESMLLKVTFDSFYADESSRPRMKLVRGFNGDNPAGLRPDEAMNHAWVTLDTAGGERIFDPRLGVLGDTREQRPGYQPGNEVPQLRPREVQPDAGPARYQDLIGEEVGYKGETWRIKEFREGDVVLVADALKDNVQFKDLKALNPEVKEFKIGETYKVKRSDHRIDDGWVLLGWRDPVKRDGLMLMKIGGVERTVPLEEVKRVNLHVFADNVQDSMFRAAEASDAARAQDYGLVAGREVTYQRRKWYVHATETGAIELTRPSERDMSPEEYKRLNGETQPVIGQEVWYQRSTGEAQRWRVVGYDEATGKVKVRSETAVRTKVPLERLLSENQEIQMQHRPVDVRKILSDPRSRVHLDCRWTDGDSGHDKWIGHVDGPNGERIKIMAHKPPGGGGTWNRLRNDLAAQSLADLMLGPDRKLGDPGIFPSTVKRNGVMVQAFAGQEGENLHVYLHGLSRLDQKLRREEPELDNRIEKLLAKANPKLQEELARGVAFSLLLGDGDQHGQNFLIERTGPNPEDIRVMRVDTDYAFGTHSEPYMDRQPNYGGVVNGAFKYFSGRAIPDAVLAEIKRVSDFLNPGDRQTRDQARNRFARENKLTREQVDALADRARSLAVGGRFPISRDWREPGEGSVMGSRPRDSKQERKQALEGESILGPHSVLQGPPPVDIERACEFLKSSGFSEGQLKALREAHETLAKDIRNVYSERALEALRTISTAGHKLTRDHVELIAALIVEKAKHPEINFDVLKLTQANIRSSRHTKGVLDRLGALDKLQACGVEASTVDRMRAVVNGHLESQNDASRLAEISRVLERCMSREFDVQSFGNERMAVFAELLEDARGYEHLQVPLEMMLDAKIDLRTLKFVREKFAEARDGGFEPPRSADGDGLHIEDRCSRAAMDALFMPLPDGRKVIFIPSANGAQADGHGIDGVLVDLTKGQVYPIDWTDHMAKKETEGKDLWATNVPDKAAGIKRNPTDQKGIRLLRGLDGVPQYGAPDLEKMQEHLERFMIDHPAVDIAKFDAKLKFPMFHGDNCLKNMHDFVREFDRRYPYDSKRDRQTSGDPVLDELYARAKNSIPSRVAEQVLGDFLCRGLAQAVDSAADRRVPIAFDPRSVPIQIDTARINEMYGKPMRFVELSLDKPLDSTASILSRAKRSTIKTVRLYEDGSIVGYREFDGKLAAVELGHISHIAEAAGRLLEPREGERQETTARRQSAQRELAKLARVNCANPIEFPSAPAVVRLFGEAVTQSQPLLQAAQRRSNIDDVLSKLQVSEDEARQTVDRAIEKEIEAARVALRPPNLNRKWSREEYQRCYDEIKLEQDLKIDRERAAAVLDQAQALSNAGLVKGEARDAAALIVLEGMGEAQAKATAKIMAALRMQSPDIPFAKAERIAKGERAFESASGAASVEVREALLEAVKAARPGFELADIYKVLMDTAERKALSSDSTAQAWSALHDRLDGKDGEERLGEFLGIERGTPAAEITAHVRQLKDRLESRMGTVLRGPVEIARVRVDRGLVNDELVGRFHEQVMQWQEALKEKPAEAGQRLRNSLVEFFNEQGLEKVAGSVEGLQISFSADAQQPVREYISKDGKKVVRKSGEFFLEDGRTKVADADVKMRLTLPEALLKAGPGELTRALYVAVLERTNKGANGPAELQGMYAFVTESLGKHVTLPVGRLAQAESGGLNLSTLPPEQAAKPVEVAIGENGIRINGIERELSFADVWRQHIENLKDELKGEEGKSQPDQERIKALKERIQAEELFAARLDPRHAHRGEHEAALKLAKERLQAFKTSEGEVERVAREKGGGSNARGRLVAVTILASFLLGEYQKSRAKEGKDPLGAEPGRPPGHEAVPVRERAGTTLVRRERPAVVLDPMDGGNGGREGKKPGHEDVPETPNDKKPDGQDVRKDAGDRVAQPKLSDLPNSALTQAMLLAMLVGLNEKIKLENAVAKQAGKGTPEKPLFDEEKLRAEWARNQFGPESRRVWQAAREFIQDNALTLMRMLDARGLQFPPGAPVAPAMSESGSGLRENDEMFRARLRAGLVTVDLNLRDLQDGQLPDLGEVERLINAKAWCEESAILWQKAFIDGQATHIDQSLRTVALLSKNGLEGWKKPQGAPPEQLERWSMAASDWAYTATRVRNYAETIAAFNAATTSRGVDWPSLNNLFKGGFLGDWQQMLGLPPKTTVFPDDAIKDANFPGRVIRDEKTGAVKKIELELPDTLDRSEANLKKIAKLETWLQKWSPGVDKVCDKLLQAMQDQDRMLMWVEDSEFELTKKLSTTEAEALRKLKENSGLKGDESDVGRSVTVPGHGSDWRVKSLKNGGYELERIAPNGQEFNLKRYGFTTEKCDAKGNPDANGDYVKVTSYQDYLWARDYAYNNWNIGGFIHEKAGAIQKVHRKTIMEGQIFHKHDFVPIIDDGRMRLMQAMNLEDWAKAQEWAKQTGNVVNTLVDVGMALEGGAEFRAAYLAAAKTGSWAAVKGGLRAGAWHFFLAGTGFGKQAILNHMPYGHEFMKVRHILIMADMTMTLTPAKFQEGVWSKIPGYAERAKAMEAYRAGTLEGLKWYDSVLKGAHKVYEGKKLLPYTPQIGIFPLCDYYFLAQFTDTLRAIRPGDDQKEKLIEAMMKHRRSKGSDLPLYASPEQITPAQVRKASQAALDDYALKLSSTREGTAQSERIDKFVQEAAALPKEKEQERRQCVAKLLDIWQNSSLSAEKLAAARGLLLLSKDEQGRLPDKLGTARSGERTVEVSSAQVLEYLSRHPQQMARRALEVAKLPAESAERKQLEEELVRIFQTARGGEERAAAARALLSLAVDAEGKPVELPKSTRLNRQQLEKVVEASGEGLVRRAFDLVLLDHGDPKREEFAKQAAEISANQSSPERDRTAAAIVLLLMRESDDPDEGLSARGTRSSEALQYLRERATQSASLDIRLAAGDFLFRTAKATESNLRGQERILSTLQEQLKLKPDDPELKKQSEAAQASIETTAKFQKGVNFNAGDFASLCMEILRSESASREQKLEALVSPAGPRLAWILDKFKHEIEPGQARDPDAVRKMSGMAGLYGRDAAVITKLLQELAANAREDPDVRALAAQVLVNTAADRQTVNGVPLTPAVQLFFGSAGRGAVKGEGIKEQHAAIKVGADGVALIRDLGGSTTIIRDGQEIKVGPGWTRFNPGDRILLGDKEKGAELFLGHERLEGMASLGAQVQEGREKPGAIADAYRKRLQQDLTALQPPSGPLVSEYLISRYRAIKASSYLGAFATGDDAAKHKSAIADALADCVNREEPAVAYAALETLTAAHLAAMSDQKRHQFRDRALKLMSHPGIDPASIALRKALAEKLPDIIYGGTPEQRNRAAGMLESLLIPDAYRRFGKRDSTINYPQYPVTRPEIRVAALEALTRLDPDRAAEIAVAKLLGGKFEGTELAADVAAVRLAAAQTLEKVSPRQLQEVALKALRTESDPVVLSKLWNLEYGARRPDLDPVKAMRELEALEERIKKRAQPGLLEDGKAIYEEMWKRYGRDWMEEAWKLNLMDGKTDVHTPEAVRARKALIYVATTPDNAFRERAATVLSELCVLVGQNDRIFKENKGDKLAQELCGPLESVLLSNPQMSPEIRSVLVSAYMSLRPGENGVVSKDEAAVVLARVLENEMRRMPRVPQHNFDQYSKSLRLQQRVLKHLEQLKSDKITALLEAISYKEPLRAVDEKERPKLVDYGGMARKFEFDKLDQLLRFTELPSGKVFEREQKEPGTFKTKDGEILKGVTVNTRAKMYDYRGESRQWTRFDRFNVKGDFADFCYSKDGKSYVQKPNGMLITEELTASTRKVTMTYSGGKESREFLFTAADKGAELVVTSLPDGKKETWQIGNNGSLSGRGPNGEQLLRADTWALQHSRARGEILPWDFDRGDYIYVVEAHKKLRYVDSSNAIYEVEGEFGSEKLVKRGVGDPAAHPLREVSMVARKLANMQRETGELAKQAADTELRYIRQSQQADAKFQTPYSGQSPSATIADAMGSKLADATADGFEVVKALHLGMLCKPLEGANDARLTVLRAALKDGNELVRLTAAQYLKGSPVGADKEAAVFTLVDVWKNGTSSGRSSEAEAMVKLLQATDSKLVAQAVAETPVKPRLADGDRPDGLGVVRDVKYQNAFEKIRATLVQGHQEILTWDWADWNRIMSEQGLELLSSGGLAAAMRAAEDQLDKNRGKMTTFFTSKETLEAERKRAREGVIPLFWRELEQLTQHALEGKDDDQKSIQARKALAYLVMDNASTIPTAEKARVVQISVDAIKRICTENGPGRGQMDWIICLLLTEKPDLSVSHRMKLLECLDALADSKTGTIQQEKAAGIAALALEQQMRFMPRPDQPGYQESLQYQGKLLEFLEKYGNREMSMAVAFVARQHPDQGIRQRADQVKNAIEQKAVAGVKRNLMQVLADTANGGKFPPIAEASDERINLLMQAVNDGALALDQRLRAAEILMARENRGVNERQRLAAAAVYCDIGLNAASEKERYRTAAVVIDHTNPLFTAEQQEKAAVVVQALAASAENEEVRKQATRLFDSFTGDDVVAVIKSSIGQVREHLAAIEQKRSVRQRRMQADIDQLAPAVGYEKARALVREQSAKYGPEPKADEKLLSQRFAQIRELTEKAAETGKGQALLLSFFAEAAKGISDGQPDLKELRLTIERILAAMKTETISNDKDPRLDAMMRLLENKDEKMSLEIAQILTHAQNKVTYSHRNAGWYTLAQLSLSEEQAVRKAAAVELEKADLKEHSNVLLRAYLNAAIECGFDDQKRAREHQCWEKILNILDKTGEPKDSELYKQAKLRFAQTSSSPKPLETAAMYEQLANDEAKKSVTSGKDADSRDWRAREYWRQAMKARESSMNKDDPELARCRLRYAQFILDRSGSTRSSYEVVHSEAMKQLEEAVRVLRAKEPKSADLIKALMVLAELSRREREDEKNRSYLEEACRSFDRNDKNNVLLQAECYSQLSLLYSGKKKPEEAQKLLTRLTDLAKLEISTQARIDLLSLAVPAATALIRSDGGAQAAVDSLQELLAQVEKLEGEVATKSWHNLADALWWAAEALEKRKEYTIADRLYLRSLEAMEKAKESRAGDLRKLYLERKKAWTG